MGCCDLNLTVNMLHQFRRHIWVLFYIGQTGVLRKTQPCEIEIPTKDKARLRAINSRECLPRCWEGCCCSSSSLLYIRFALTHTHTHTQAAVYLFFLRRAWVWGNLPQIVNLFLDLDQLGCSEGKVSLNRSLGQNLAFRLVYGHMFTVNW
jgi:hypothetical protein